MKLDGRPMSGDIGRGATKETIAFAIELAKAKNRPPGLYSIIHTYKYMVLENLQFCNKICELAW